MLKSKPFLIKLVFVTIFAICILITWKTLIPTTSKFYPHLGEQVLFYFIITTLIAQTILQNVLNSRQPKEFTMVFMSILVIKFLLTLALLIVYMVVYGKLTLNFSSYFMVIYTVFTIFETLTFLKLLKK
jgi:hypothetical protein